MHERVNLQSYILCVRIPPHPQTASHVSLAHKCCAGWASSSAGGLPKGGAPPGLSCEHNTYPMCFSKHKPRLNKHAVVQPTSWPTNVGLTHSPPSWSPTLQQCLHQKPSASSFTGVEVPTWSAHIHPHIVCVLVRMRCTTPERLFRTALGLRSSSHSC